MSQKKAVCPFNSLVIKAIFVYSHSKKRTNPALYPVLLLSKMVIVRFLLITLIALASCCQQVLGQEVHSIIGVVKDTINKPLEYGQVILRNDADQIVTSETTDGAGSFILKAKNGIYLFNISYLGKVIYKKRIELTSDLNLSEIKVNVTLLLSQVVVTGKKKLFERQTDRLTYNVENSIASSGMNLIEALKTTPLVKVDDKTIKLAGKNSVVVMINNRPINIDGEDLLNYLKSFRSDDVSKIEIITTPPAKYDAAGNSGFINIELKKNPNLGWNGNASAVFTQATYSSGSAGGTLNYRSKKVSASLRIRQFGQQTRVTEQNNIISYNSLVSSNLRKDEAIGYGANLNMSLDLNSRNTIGLIFDLANTNNVRYISNTAAYFSGDTQDSVLTTDNIQKNPIRAQSLNLYYETKFDTLGRKAAFNFTKFNNSPFKTGDLVTTSSSGFMPSLFRNSSDMEYSIWSGQGDLTLPMKFINVETGLKYTGLTNYSDVKFYTLVNKVYHNEADKSNEFEYDERIYAAYVASDKKFDDKWSAQLGLRYEYTNAAGTTPSTGVSNKYFYGNLFPSAYLQYKVNENNTFGFNYARRVNRPGFNSLNPFRWYSNPYIYSTGNPLLQPYFIQNLEFNYIYKNALNITLFGQVTTNGSGGITTFEDGIKISTIENYLTQHNIGISSNVDLNPTAWWNSANTLTVFYSNSSAARNNVVTTNGFSAVFSSNNTMTLSKAKNLFLLVNISNSFPSREINVYTNNIYDFSVGARYSVLEKRILFNVTMQDIFKGSISTGEIYFEQFKQTFNNYYDNRRFILSATYNFGNKRVKEKNRQYNLSEKSRAN